MNPRLKKFLKKSMVVCGYVLLYLMAFIMFCCIIFLGVWLFEPIRNFILAATGSAELLRLIIEIVAPIYLLLISFVACAIGGLCYIFSKKIVDSYESFKSESDDFTSSEIYKDPTIALKDKIIFFLIHLIY